VKGIWAAIEGLAGWRADVVLIEGCDIANRVVIADETSGEIIGQRRAFINGTSDFRSAPPYELSEVTSCLTETLMLVVVLRLLLVPTFDHVLGHFHPFRPLLWSWTADRPVLTEAVLGEYVSTQID